MMKYILPIFTIFIFICIFSCTQSSRGLSEIDRKLIIAEIKLTLDNYYSDIGKSGLTAEFKYLDNSNDFFWVPPGYSSALSYDSVHTVLTQNAPKYKTIYNIFDTLTIIPLNHEIAVYTAKIRSFMKDTAGKSMNFSLIETGTLIKRKGDWKLLNGQTSRINP